MAGFGATKEKELAAEEMLVRDAEKDMVMKALRRASVEQDPRLNNGHAAVAE